MPDNVIAWIDFLGWDQPIQLSFQDRYGVDVSDERLTVSHPSLPHVEYEFPGNVAEIPKIPGVNPVKDQLHDTSTNDTTTEDNKNDFEIMPIDPTPAPPEPSLVVNTNVTPTPAVEEDVRRSTHACQPMSRYEQMMTGKRYGHAATQLAEQQRYEHMFVLAEEESPEFNLRVIKYIFNQLTIKATMKLWGDNAVKASEKEMKQLHWCKSFQHMHWSELNEEQCKNCP